MGNYSSDYKLTLPNKLLLEQIIGHTAQGKSVRIPVKGNSMRPFLYAGDQVLLKPVEKRELQLGMIVLAHMEGAMILHRVVKFGEESLWLAGDANLAQHEELQYGHVLGRVVLLYRRHKVIQLNQQWRYKQGQLWYRARPLRRVFRKIWSL